MVEIQAGTATWIDNFHHKSYIERGFILRLFVGKVYLGGVY
jgi:hypothetical protein